MSPATVVEAVDGDPPRAGQSPFALAAGDGFETQLFESGAARLSDLYRRRGRLGMRECGVVSVPEVVPGTSAGAMARHQTLISRFLQQKLNGDPLSGRADTAEVELVSGRTCAALSGHRVAWFVPARAGIEDLLLRFVSSGDRILGSNDDREYDGWRTQVWSPRSSAAAGG